MGNESMDLQKLTFFTEGNTFTGSRTKDWNTRAMLRYLVRPDQENDKLLAYSWTEDVCFELADKKQEGEFPLSDEGLYQIQAWLHEQYDNLDL